MFGLGIRLVFGAGLAIGGLLGYKTGNAIGKRSPEAKARKVFKTVKNVKTKLMDEATKAVARIDKILEEE